jgi:hypothetical protein
VKLRDISGEKKKEYLEAKLDELQINSMTKNIRDMYRGLNHFKKVYQPTTNVKDEKGDLITNSHSMLARWRNHSSQPFNIHGLNDVRQTEVETAALLVPKIHILINFIWNKEELPEQREGVDQCAYLQEGR